MKIEFEDLMPQLIKIDERCKEGAAGFKKAYNYIRKLKEKKVDDDVVRLCWSGPDYEEPYIQVWHMHNADWQNVIAREIVVEKDVHLSEVGICAYCLWEITFWGFTPQQEAEHFSRLVKRK